MRFGKAGRDEPSARIRRLEAVTEDVVVPWRLPWPLMTAAAALVTAGAGWLLVAGFCLLGWITVPQIKVVSVLQLATQGWLLAHGISVALPGATLSIAPLGLTLCIVLVGLGACQQAVIHSKPPPADAVGVRVVRMGLVFGLLYVLIIAVARSWTETGRIGVSFLAAAALVFGLGLLASGRALGWQPRRVPVRVRALGLAVLAGCAIMVASGAAVFITALIRGRERVVMLHDALQPGALGGVMLLLGQLAWAPNFVLWGGAWAIGAGIQLGVDTVISPSQSLVGMLPSIPVLGAVPVAGPMPPVSLLWLTSGVLAGVAAAYVLVTLVRREPGRRPPGMGVAAIIGALAGMICGLTFTLLQVPGSGDLGAIRLVDLGARMPALAIMASTSMGLAGMATGACMGWWSGRVKPAPAQPLAIAALAEVDVPTTVVADLRSAASGDE